MNYLKDGGYVKIDGIYKPKKSKLPFLTPWEVFEDNAKATRAVYLKKGKEVLVIEPKSRRRRPGL